ncbi:uncharacterized protein LOC9639196 [Selaginella moellendorffii]|uniref:uncharacterized protein LOC9639196 n=1 Tax=Selaginella moellendorffii TaxID=88036 RepID=UPI000D1CDF4E|nr:uncharacterized protein LOC9639196 [Selaginella moellendorffii]|eukprot:XP_024538072.1 uncharacterized protein LOC9639196 [Selaginella moellendorffii]
MASLGASSIVFKVRSSMDAESGSKASNGNSKSASVRVGSSGKPLHTTLAGAPVSDDNNSVTIGQSGHLLFEDVHLFEKQARLNRERVPERVVHAKGAGAHGYFEVTKDVSNLCKAKFLSEPGKRTPVFARFSSVAAERGFTDLARDVRGFAVKFYTEEGNWDMTGNNTPVFWVRDPLKFPDFVHSQKRNPKTNAKDPNAFWDFLSLVPESMHQLLITFSPRGVPATYRNMNGYGSHTFKWVNKEGKAHWVKFHLVTEHGIKNLTHEEAVSLSGSKPDYATEDLLTSIEEGNFPAWKFCVQVMPLEDAPKYKWDPFDLTKVWLHKDYPLMEVGRLVLDRNVENYHAEVEQAAFSPGSFVPGIEASPDRILQSRLFAYDDAARYRIGTNFHDVPINKPIVKVQTYSRDGAMVVSDNGGSKPNYYPNSYDNLPRNDPTQPDVHPYEHEGGTVDRFPPRKWEEQDDYEQPRMLWKLMSEEDKEQTVSNIANHIRGAAEFIQERQMGLFRKCDGDLASRIEKKLAEKKKSPEPYTMIA